MLLDIKNFSCDVENFLIRFVVLLRIVFSLGFETFVFVSGFGFRISDLSGLYVFQTRKLVLSG
jgi:hypothetical protein